VVNAATNANLVRDFFMSVFLARVGFRAMRVYPNRARRMPKIGARKPMKTQKGRAVDG
jgi:hypothetical protein